jgi:hypothetical protein
VKLVWLAALAVGAVVALPPAASTAKAPTDARAAAAIRIAGTYGMYATREQIDSAPGHVQGASDNWGSFRLILQTKRFRITDRRPSGQLVQGYASGWTVGRYLVRGDRIRFFIQKGFGDTPLGRLGDTPISCRWSLYRNALTLRQTFKDEGPPLLFVKPWRRTG